MQFVFDGCSQESLIMEQVFLKNEVEYDVYLFYLHVTFLQAKYRELSNHANLAYFAWKSVIFFVKLRRL